MVLFVLGQDDVGVGGIGGLDVVQQVQNVGAVGDGVIAHKLQLRGVAQVQAVAQLAAQEAGAGRWWCPHG